MVKIPKLQIIRVPVEIEYKRSITGRLYALYGWFRFIILKRVNLILNKRSIANYYILAIPRFEVNKHGNA